MEHITDQKNVWVHGSGWVATNLKWFALSFFMGTAIMKISEGIRLSDPTDRAAFEDSSWSMVPIPAGQERAARELYRLIDTHPSEEVREDLKARIVYGDVIVGYASIPWQEGQRPVAEFLLMPTPQGIRQEFVVDPKRLLLSSEYSTASKQIMLYHGWIHVKQQREHRYPDWLGIIRTEHVPLSTDGLKTLFESEAGAFLEECHLARRLGMTKQIPHCEALETGGRHAMRMDLVKTYALVPSLLSSLIVFTDAVMEED